MKAGATIVLVAFTATAGGARADSYTACVNDSVLGVHGDAFTVAWRITAVRGSAENTGAPNRPGQKGPPLSKPSGVLPGTHVTLNFAPTGIVLDAAAGAQRMQRAQLDSWRPVIEELRTAAANKILIRVSFDEKSKAVTGLQLLYSQRCP